MAVLSVVFMGTPDFAVPALDAIRGAGHRLVAVYTQPPRPAGRGHRETRSPVHDRALAHGLAVEIPATLKDEAAQARFAAYGADVAVVAAYGLILPPPVLDAPRLGCLNIHASLLPRWRGAAPIQHAIWAGDTESGITIMQMDAGLDTGPMLLREAVPIGPATRGADLHDDLATVGARLILAALDGVAAGTLAPEPQDESRATYAPKLSRDDGRLNWRRPAVELERQVRAFDPWPGTWFDLDGRRIRVLAAEVVAGAKGSRPGTVTPGATLVVACADGTALRLARVQPEGRAAMDDAAFLNGLRLAAATVLP